MRYFLSLIFLLLIITPALADTHTAASCSKDDITTAITAASAGDIVAVPAGSCTWDTQVVVNKAITLQGAGSDQTIITRGAISAGYSMCSLQPTSDMAIRITGFKFDNGTNNNTDKIAIAINGKTDNSFVLTQIRIDHNYFNKGKRAVNPTGAVYGLIDSNTFNNCDIAIGPTGDNNHAWNRAITAGSANALFIESNTFTADEAGRDRNLNQQVYIQSGARVVIRYNTIDLSAVTGSGAAGFIDSHGNQGGCATPFDTMRSQPITEIYNNNLIAGAASSIGSYVFIDLRGGSVLAYNNAFTTTSGVATPIRLWEEESYASGNFPTGPCTTYPVDDQTNNSFFWNNTYNGSAITDVTLHSSMPAEGYITKNTDYFMAAPAASGQVAQTLPSVATYGSVTGQKYHEAGMTSAAGASIYYPYSRAACPHPLVGSGSCDSTVKGTTGYTVTGLGTTFAPWVH